MKITSLLQTIVIALQIFCIPAVAEAQTHYCDVYQFAGTDSSHKKIALKQTFNAQWQLTSQTYTGYKNTAVQGTSDGTYFYFYRDTLLVQRTFIDEGEDSTKALYSYNQQSQLVKTEHFTFQKRLRKNADKGLGRPGGCIVTEKDYEKERSWKQTSVINYSYNTAGQVVLYDATQLHFSSQNRYTWAYDSLGRIAKHSSFDNNRRLSADEYHYFDGGYSFVQTWYDYDGNPKQLKTEAWEYSPVYTHTFTTDSKGRVLKEVVTTEKGETLSTETTAYNADGRISRTVYYNGKGEPEITHIYVYR